MLYLEGIRLVFKSVCCSTAISRKALAWNGGVGFAHIPKDPWRHLLVAVAMGGPLARYTGFLIL